MTAVAALLTAAAVLVATGRPRGATGRGGRERSARPTVTELAEAVDHLALALRGGAPLVAAIRQVGVVSPASVGADLRAVAAAIEWGVDEEQAWSAVPAHWAPVSRAMLLAQRAGVPPADLLSVAAADLRRDQLADLERRTARLSVHLVLPLGLAFLPAFVLSTVVPVVLALAGDVLGSLE